MPAVSNLSLEQWAEVREAAIAGVSYPALAEKYGVEANTIKQRAWAEDWPTPARVLKLRAEYQTKSIGNGGNLTQPNSTPKSIDVIAETLAGNGQQGSLHASNLFLRKLKRAVDNPDSIKDLETVGDVKIAMSGIRSAAGMDKPQTALAISFSGLSSQPTAQIEIREAQVLDSEQDAEE